MRVAAEHTVNEFMNKIKLLLRRSHIFPGWLILREAARGIQNSGFFEVPSK